MSTVELVFAVIGSLIVIGGFAYGIYDSYFQSNKERHVSTRRSSDSKSDTSDSAPLERWH